MQIDRVNKIIERAKSKSDGCYRAFCIAYRVRNGCVTHFAHRGEVFEFCYGFLAKIGTYDGSGINSDEVGQKLLRGIK